MGVETGCECVETSIERIETRIHPTDERVEPDIDVIQASIDAVEPSICPRGKRVDPAADAVDPTANAVDPCAEIADLPNCTDELPDVQRLRDVPVETCCQEPLAVSVHRLCGHGEHWDRGRAFVRAQPAKSVHAVDVR